MRAFSLFIGASGRPANGFSNGRPKKKENHEISAEPVGKTSSKTKEKQKKKKIEESRKSQKPNGGCLRARGFKKRGEEEVSSVEFQN